MSCPPWTSRSYWVEAQAEPGERYITQLVTSTNTPVNPTAARTRTGMTFSGTEVIRDLVQRLGLDDADKVGLAVDSTFLAHSDRRVF